MKLIKRKGYRKYHAVIEDKDISLYRIYIYTEDGIQGVNKNSYHPELEKEIDIENAVFMTNPDLSYGKTFIAVERNEYGRKQKSLYLPLTKDAKKEVVKSKMNDLAKRIIDYDLYFYQTIVSPSDLYFELGDEMDKEKAEEIGRKLNSALRKIKSINAVRDDKNKFSDKE